MTVRKHAGVTGLAVFALAAASLVLAGPQDHQQGHEDKGHGDKDMHASAKIGEQAPDFALKDTDGKEHKLSDYKGKIVVLEWFNPGCPFIKLHHEKQSTFADLYKDYHGKDVVILAINSTNADHADYGKDAQAKKDWKIEYPILSDANGKVGHAYGAKTTPHVFVIDKDGKLAYSGAIDNDARMQKQGDDKVNYVRNALDELLAGKAVSKAETRPYGCSVKYGS